MRPLPGPHTLRMPTTHPIIHANPRDPLRARDEVDHHDHDAGTTAPAEEHHP
jgi:hypothetical protein